MPRKKKNKFRKFFGDWWGKGKQYGREFGKRWDAEDNWFYPTTWTNKTTNQYVITEISPYHWVFDKWCGYKFMTFRKSQHTPGHTIQSELDWFKKDVNAFTVEQQEAIISILYDPNYIWNINTQTKDRMHWNLFRSFVTSMRLEQFFLISNRSVKQTRMIFELIMDELHQAMAEMDGSGNPLNQKGEMSPDNASSKESMKKMMEKMDQIMGKVTTQMQDNFEKQQQLLMDMAASQPKEGTLNRDSIKRGFSPGDAGVEFRGRTWEQFKRMKKDWLVCVQNELNHLSSDIVGFAYKDGDISGNRPASILEGVSDEILEILSPEALMMNLLPLMEVEVPSQSDKMVDVYVDYSGSMNEMVTYKLPGGEDFTITKALALIVALKMLQEKAFVRKVIPFANHVVDMEKVPPFATTGEPREWYHADPSGGTSFTAPYLHFAANGYHPAVMITDGQGQLEYYHRNFNIVVIGPPDYIMQQNPDVIPVYKTHGQLISTELRANEQTIMNQRRMVDFEV